jgi:uncharacterized protein YhbP (UPF0306 family)
MKDSIEFPHALVAHLEAGKLMQLASLSSDGPRVFSVWYAIGDDANSLVFISNRHRNHSEEFARDARAGGTIVAIELKGLGQKVEGVSFFGKITEPQGESLAAAYRAYAEKWPIVQEMFSIADVAAGKTDMCVYKLIVSQWIFFSEREYPDSPRQEFEGAH